MDDSLLLEKEFQTKRDDIIEKLIALVINCSQLGFKYNDLTGSDLNLLVLSLSSIALVSKQF